MKKAKTSAPTPFAKKMTAAVYYYPIVGRFVLFFNENEHNDFGRFYSRTTIMRDIFRPKCVGIIGSYERQIKEISRNPFVVYLGTTPNFGAMSINGVGDHNKLRKSEREELMGLLEKNIAKVLMKGPVKVKEFTHAFRYKDYEFEVESYVDRKQFLTQCPEFKKFKPKRTQVSEHWIERKKLKPDMTVVKIKVV